MYRITGAMLIIAGCGLAGKLRVNVTKRNISMIEAFVCALNIMICELEFHRLPLPSLCTYVSNHATGILSEYFLMLEQELSSQSMPDVRSCSDSAMRRLPGIPDEMIRLFNLLADSLGLFEIGGQLDQLQYVKTVAESTLEDIRNHHERFRRANQTLWICAGVTIAVILF